MSRRGESGHSVQVARNNSPHWPCGWIAACGVDKPGLLCADFLVVDRRRLKQVHFLK